MKLLILTQKVEINDDVLGFFHGWIAALAKNFEKITVVALCVGKYDFPTNVRIFSLGKDSKFIRRTSKFRDILNRARYLINFYKLIWQERKNYDTVFVHMNKEYVVLGGILWRLWGKRIALWYNHRYGSFLSGLAGRLTHIIFYTSPYSYFAKNKKSQQMPVGIDTALFKIDPGIQKRKNSILFLGRVAPVKKVEILIGAAKLLNEQGADFSINIVGDAIPRDKAYLDNLKKLVKDHGLEEKVKFFGALPNHETPRIYNEHEIFVNLTDAGSLDKTIFEAMACGCLVLTSNRTLTEIIPIQWQSSLIFTEDNAADLAGKLHNMFILSDEKKAAIIDAGKQISFKHNLEQLIKKIMLSL